MKRSQSRHHLIAKRVLTTPDPRRVARSRPVDPHVDVWTDRSAHRRAERRHLSALFDAPVDAYRECIGGARGRTPGSGLA